LRVLLYSFSLMVFSTIRSFIEAQRQDGYRGFTPVVAGSFPSAPLQMSGIIFLTPTSFALRRGLSESRTRFGVDGTDKAG
jgi:hypothetical protein